MLCREKSVDDGISHFGVDCWSRNLMPSRASCGGCHKGVFCSFISLACCCWFYCFRVGCPLILLLLLNHIINVAKGFLYEQAGYLRNS